MKLTLFVMHVLVEKVKLRTKFLFAYEISLLFGTEWGNALSF